MLVFAAVGVVTGFGLGGFRLWQGRFPWEAAVPAVLTLPAPEADVARARSNKIGPAGGLVQVFTDQNAQVTLEIPAGALKEETDVKLIPFAFDPSAQTPTLGALVSPGSLAFAQSARLVFDLSQSKFHLTAPDAASADLARRSGESQLLHLAGDEGVVIPTLAVRPVETKTSFTGLVPTGGTYLLSFGGENRVAYARQGLVRTPSRDAVLEAAAFIKAHGAALSKEEQAKASAASRSVLDEKNPRGEEFFAAVAVATAPTQKTALVPVARAAEINRSFFQKGCTDRTRAFADVASLAHAARLLGDKEMAKTCWDAANRQAASTARAVLSDRKAELPAMLAARTSLRVAGGSEAAELGKQLAASASKDVQAEARVVLAKAKPSAPAVAAVLQTTRVVSTDAPVKQQLAERLQEVAPHTPLSLTAPTVSGGSSGAWSAPETVVGGQELVAGSEDVVVGLGIATTLGFDPLTDPSYQAWMQELLRTTTFPSGNTSAADETTMPSDGAEGPAFDYDPTAYLCMMAALYGVPDMCPASTTDAVDAIQDHVSDEGTSDGTLADAPGEDPAGATAPGTTIPGMDLTWWAAFSWMNDPNYLASLSAGSSDAGEGDEQAAEADVETEDGNAIDPATYAPGTDPFLFLNTFGLGTLWTPPVNDDPAGDGEEQPVDDAVNPDDRGDGPESEEEARDQGILPPSDAGGEEETQEEPTPVEEPTEQPQE